MKNRNPNLGTAMLVAGIYGPWIVFALAWAWFAGALAGWWTP